MEIIDAIRQRHSVRRYTLEPIKTEHRIALEEFIANVNEQSGLHIQLVINEPKAFGSFFSHYGAFSGVTNYLALVGKKSDDFDEKIGYWGEKVVLFAQTLSLNTCWVALTYKKIKDAFVVGENEKLSMVIAIGYGENQGKAHKSKSKEKVSNVTKDCPQWFVDGVESALLAPTAINQQAFYIKRDGNKVKIIDKKGPCSKVDLGIVKYHFEVGAKQENFEWDQ